MSMADESPPGASAVGPREEPEQDLQNRLDSVQDALQEIEDQVQQDAESLERLRSVLDVSYLEEITRMINELELKVNEVADEAARARKRADEAEEELATEQERLEKLWDVYKEQERELEQAQEDRAEAIRRVEEAEERVSELEEELDSERQALRQAQKENGRLREELSEKEAEVETLSNYEDLEEKVDELEDELEEERGRLAKLYGVFEETEAERDDLRARLRQWDAWFEAHEDVLQGVVQAVNEAPEPPEQKQTQRA